VASRSPQQVKTPKPVGFFRKFFELQLLMLQHNAGLTASHPYASAPINWPFLLSGISFWTQNEGQKQIYLIGNIVGWWACALALSLYVGILGADLLAKRRGINPIPIGKFAIVERYHSVLTQGDYSRSQSPMELCRLFRGCLACPLFPILPHESTTIHPPLSPLSSCICACRWRSASLPPVRDYRIPYLDSWALHETTPETMGRARYSGPYHCRRFLHCTICRLRVPCSFNLRNTWVCFTYLC
jgi:hypothetical protein